MKPPWLVGQPTAKGLPWPVTQVPFISLFFDLTHQEVRDPEAGSGWESGGGEYLHTHIAKGRDEKGEGR